MKGGDQILEIQKYQKYISQLEQILTVSKYPEQRERVSKDIKKFKEKILSLSPDGIPDNVYSSAFSSNKKGKDVEEDNDSLLNHLIVLKLSPHCNNAEVNFISTLINIMENELLPILSDTHIKLDFSHSSQRDDILKIMENIRRNLKVLAETIEEYAMSDKQDFKEQLGRMKNKQTRIFFAEAVEVFKQFKEFLQILCDSVNTGSTIVKNPDDKIRFNQKFEKATFLEGRTVKVAVKKFLQFTKEALENINLPTFKK